MAKPSSGSKGATGATGARGKRGAANLPFNNPDKEKAGGFPVKMVPYYDDPQLKGRLDEVGGIAEEVRNLQVRRNKLDDLIKEKNTVIRALMETVDDSQSWSIRADEWTASFVKPSDRKTLVPELLIQAGVTLIQLEKGTKSTPVTPYVTVKSRDEK